VYWGKEKQTLLRDIVSGCADVLLTSYDTFRKDFEVRVPSYPIKILYHSPPLP